MNKVLLVLSLTISISLLGQSSGQSNMNYHYSMDLNKVNNDLLKVKLIVPKISEDKIIYNIPKIVPGTYDIYDFGQYASDMEAFDKDGRALTVNRLNHNRWEIEDATKLHSITYWVEDTWDAEDVKDFVFEPGGTNIEEGENFVINNHGFFGYFEGMKNMPCHVSITRPDGFYGTTGISQIKSKDNTDTYTVSNYMDLVDSPIMYNTPDTTVIQVGGAEVLVSVYSKNKVATSAEIAEDIKEILYAQRNYLGGKLPVSKYAFIIYLYEGQSGSGGSGALEHSYSSLYYLPEMPAKNLSGIMVDVVSPGTIDPSISSEEKRTTTLGSVCISA